MLFILILQRRKPRHREGQAQDPRRCVGKPRLQPQALAAPTVPRNHERGVSGPFSEQPRGEGRARGGAPGGPHTPSPAWVTPCCAASRLLPLSPGVTKELNQFKRRETSHVRRGAQNPHKRVIYQEEMIGTPLTERLWDAGLQSQQPDKLGEGSSDAPPLGCRVNEGPGELRGRKGGSQDMAVMSLRVRTLPPTQGALETRRE